MNPFGFAAGLLHGRDPAVTLHLVRSLVAIPLRPEGYDQARDQRGASSWQRSKQPTVGVASTSSAMRRSKAAIWSRRVANSLTKPRALMAPASSTAASWVAGMAW